MGKILIVVKVVNEILDVDFEIVVVYVNCRFLVFFDDFVGKIVKQLYYFFFRELVIGRIKSFFIEEENFYFLLLFDNFEFLVQLDDGRSMEMQVERRFLFEKIEIMKFFRDIVIKLKKVYLLVILLKNIDIFQIGQQWIKLFFFNEDDFL